jgi:hypothetical protein
MPAYSPKESQARERVHQRRYTKLERVGGRYPKDHQFISCRLALARGAHQISHRSFDAMLQVFAIL